ncbi:unnamed protein product [Protopolystoma xenopodis]|uniref:Uncharacterized protein n=1 Tax=Protopolystoma xenopodis TaxID=117903 RepID=A0A448XMD5_9PLAT|nr:unnamed protein product [Protopolystoma xenopodis]
MYCENDRPARVQTNSKVQTCLAFVTTTITATATNSRLFDLFIVDQPARGVHHGHHDDYRLRGATGASYSPHRRLTSSRGLVSQLPQATAPHAINTASSIHPSRWGVVLGVLLQASLQPSRHAGFFRLSYQVLCLA